MDAIRRGTVRLRNLIGKTRASLGDPASLGRRALSAAVWRFGGNTASQMLRLASNLVMTRLLAPEDFGLMAIAMTIQAGLMMSTDIGLNMSVVRSDHGEDPRFLRTIWTVKILKHMALAALLIALAALLHLAASAFDFGDTIYGDPALPYVLAALALTLVVRGCVSANMELGERSMRIARVIQVTFTGQLVGVLAMIGIAQFEPSVWALVWGGMIGSCVSCTLSHVIVPGPSMRPMIDRAYLREIWSFGKWLMGASIFGFLGQYGDRLILGALLSPAAFGAYAIARLWLDAGASAISKIAAPISNAALSEVRRERPKALLGTFRRIRLIQNVACLAMFALFALGGQTLIETLYTTQYHEVGAIVAMLAPLLLLRMWGPFTQLLLSTGNSRNFARVTFFRCVALYVTLPAAFYLFGPAWAYFVIATNQLWGVPNQVALAAKVVPISMTSEMIQLAGVVALAAAVTIYVS